MSGASRAHDSPSKVAAERGEVLIDGPGGIAVSMTPDAAAKTSERLSRSAAEAQRQNRNSRIRAPAADKQQSDDEFPLR